MPPNLPDEILLKIARECVEPWTLRTTTNNKNYRTTRRHHSKRLSLCITTCRFQIQRVPRLTNIKLTSKLFYDEMRKNTIDKFDGSLTINNGIDRRLVAHWSEGKKSLRWPFPIITTVYVQCELSRSIIELVTRERLPNLRHLIFETGVPWYHLKHLTADLTLKDVLEASVDQEQILRKITKPYYDDLVFRPQRGNLDIPEDVKVTIICQIEVEAVVLDVTIDFLGDNWWKLATEPDVKLSVKAALKSNRWEVSTCLL